MSSRIPYAEDHSIVAVAENEDLEKLLESLSTSNYIHDTCNLIFGRRHYDEESLMTAEVFEKHLCTYICSLAETGADLHHVDPRGMGLLHYACLYGFEDVVKLLHQSYGVELNGISNYGFSGSGSFQSTNHYTPLHLALFNDHDNIAKYLLLHGADYTIKKRKGCSCLELINQDLLNDVLDSCLFETESEGLPVNTNMEFNYAFICPIFSMSRNESHDRPSTEMYHLMQLFNEPKLNVPLDHPVIASFLHMKWQKVKWMFSFRVLFYILYLLLLTSYVLVRMQRKTSLVSADSVPTYSNDTYYNDTMSLSKNITLLPTNSSGLFTLLFDIDPGNHVTLHKIHSVCLYIFIFLAILIEIIQLLAAPLKYALSPRNIIDWILLSFLCVLLQSPEDYLSFEREFCAVLLLFGWIGLIQRLQKHVWILTLFWSVSQLFLKVLAVFGMFIAAFALTFYALFYPDPSFQSLGASLVKTIVMMIGELDYADLPLENDFIGSVIVVIFIFSIVIVVMNLMTALAVRDTQELYQEARVKGRRKQLTLMYELEIMTFGGPKEYKHFSDLFQMNSFQRISNRLLKSLTWVFMCLKDRLLLFHDDNRNLQVEKNEKEINAGYHMKVNKCGVTLPTDILTDALKLIQNKTGSYDRQVKMLKTALISIEKKLDLLLANEAKRCG